MGRLLSFIANNCFLIKRIPRKIEGHIDVKRFDRENLFNKNKIRTKNRIQINSHIIKILIVITVLVIMIVSYSPNLFPRIRKYVKC